MFGRLVNSVGAFGHLVPCNSSNVTSLTKSSSIIFRQLRTSKHWDPKFKKLRKEKVIKVKLPNFNEDENELTPEEVRSKMKEMGLQPSRPWMERQIFVSNTGGIFEAYVPPEGDGKFSAISMPGAKQKVEFMTKKGKSYLAIRKIRTFEEDFAIDTFENEAQKIYVNAHEAIARKDEEALRLLVTEKAYPEVTHNTIDKTIRWKFIQSLELPRVVHARCTDIISKQNVFSQLTVRFHNQQTLAVYDRFGRLMHGSEIVKKDVLEYVIFERHLANQYGTWRIHAKIIPPWMPPREYATRTSIETPEEKSNSTLPVTPPSDSTAVSKNDSHANATSPA